MILYVIGSVCCRGGTVYGKETIRNITKCFCRNIKVDLNYVEMCYQCGQMIYIVYGSIQFSLFIFDLKVYRV